MKKVLVSGYMGDYYKEMSKLTFERMEQYAEKHNFDSAQLFELSDYGRAASWSKIPLMIDSLANYDLVLWLDSDVFVINADEDITDVATDENIQYLAYHNVRGNRHPNCGVWMVKQPMIPYLENIWNMDQYIDHFWWEQAALIESVGMKMDPATNKVSLVNPENELYKKTGTLSSKWNFCQFDDDKSFPPNFIHFAGHPNRLEVIRGACANVI